MLSEPLLRLSCFLTTLTLFALWETIAPRRPLSQPKTKRWFGNIGLAVLDTLLLRIVFPTAAVGIAAIAQTRNWGLFNVLDVKEWEAIAGSLIALDFVIYVQHVLFHALPTLWRIHRVHHTDLDFDVTTALRFHPIEILLSMGIKILAVLGLGAPPEAVLAFEILLNASALFNHSNSQLPLALDRLLRWIIVTPDMHRVHHSVLVHETNSNYGFNLPWWDYLLGTYRSQPTQGHLAMTIGLQDYQDPCVLNLPWLLTAPFRNPMQHQPPSR
ncbi:MAG: sterol desaturase family protein [Thermosynechococcaceae cyanobacterium]